MKVVQIISQVFLFFLFTMGVWYFSILPKYIHHDPEKSLIKISFSHAGERKEECQPLTESQQAELAPNMRTTEVCERERVPLYLELELDGRIIFSEYLQPTGLADDGAATVYERFIVEPGEHDLVARMRDSRKQSGYDYIKAERVYLSAQQNFVIGFNKELGDFEFM